jgi:hypothetical protein
MSGERTASATLSFRRKGTSRGIELERFYMQWCLKEVLTDLDVRRGSQKLTKTM